MACEKHPLRETAETSPAQQRAQGQEGAGPPSTFAELYCRLHPQVYRRVLRQVKDAEEARDITQEAFAVLARHFHRLGNDLEASMLLYRVAKCKAIDQRRRKTRWSTRMNQVSMASEAQETTGPSEAERIEAAIDLALLARGAPPKARQAALLRFVEEYSLADVGTRLGVCSRTVERLLAKFVEVVRKRSARFS